MTEGMRTVRKPTTHTLAPLMAGCLILGMNLLPTHALAEELRIGMLAPMTGPFAQIGKDMTNGFEMYLEQVKNKFGGADVKLIVEDTQGKPPVAVLKAEKLIRQDQVHMFVGGLLA